LFLKCEPEASKNIEELPRVLESAFISQDDFTREFNDKEKYSHRFIPVG